MMENKYNKVPVFYCKNCLSPAIKCEGATEESIEGKFSDEFRYCVDCGGVSIGVMNFRKWEQMYKDTYGLTYLEDIDA